MSQPIDPYNNFVEFVQIWGGPFHMYCEAVIMYDSRDGGFTVQVGFKISEGVVNGVRSLQIISTTGEIMTIRRQAGMTVGGYSLQSVHGKTLTRSRTHLP